MKTKMKTLYRDIRGRQLVTADLTLSTHDDVEVHRVVALTDNDPLRSNPAMHTAFST